MSEKPQAAREDEPEDLLEQIFTQGLEKIKAPEQETAVADAAPLPPEQSDSEDGASSPAVRKAERSAVYLYLLVLFGAAFLMLLLAYFVQQRSNESAISDLRDSMNLSRTELLAQITELEKENEALNGNLSILERRYEEQAKSANNVINQLMADTQEALYAWDSFWMLEQFYQLGNYEACAAVLLMQEMGQYPYHAPSAAQPRQEQIVRAVVAVGILDEEYKQHPQDYQDLLTAYSQP